MRSRPVLTRLILASLGALLLCVLGGVGLGWAVRTNPKWLVNLLGYDRCSRLRAASICTLGTLLPADSDGDGIADSVERYMEHDPHNPLNHPYIQLLVEDPGFSCLNGFVLQPGDRRRIHARASIEAWSGVYAPGMRLLLDPEPPGLLCLPGGTPSGDPLLVPVAADGAMEFDLAIRDDAVPTGSKTAYEVEARHPLSDDYARRLNFEVVWRLPPLPCTVEEIPFTGNARGDGVGDEKGWRSAHLTWQPAGQPSGAYYIEGTRDQSGDPQWFFVDLCPGEDHEWTISYKLSNSRSGHRGPLKFRIVPTKPIPPKAPDEKDQMLTAFRLREYAPRQLFQDSDLRYMGYTIIPVASVADSPESAKAILQTIIDTQMGMVVKTETGSVVILSDVSRLEPTVCNGFYVFQIRVQTGRLIVILDSARPQAAARIFRPLRN